MEAAARDRGCSLREFDLAEQDAMWEEAKRAEVDRG
jgi:uncharacterized protein YabN with tetrapyrrole methylase and pyrophosphatase domain